ncbi:hypothetical protein MHK_000196 [Candidatus Magnetomorum sp. HK-1]|nr:hypothetical protein MHK_000196 [Candidatus Magnetomorum sp. HK-1]
MDKRLFDLATTKLENILYEQKQLDFWYRTINESLKYASEDEAKINFLKRAINAFDLNKGYSEGKAISSTNHLDNIKLFSGLTSSEVAIFWISSNPASENEHFTYPILLCSKDILWLGCVLAKEYVNAKDKVQFELNVNSQFDDYSKKIFELSYNEETLFKRQKLTHELILKQIGNGGFHDFNEIFSECNLSIDLLVKKGLIIDPPWKQIGKYLLVVLALNTPVDFTLKTEKGVEVSRSVKSIAWEYEKNQIDDEVMRKFKINSDITAFLAKYFENLSKSHIEEWKKKNHKALTDSNNLSSKLEISPKLDSDNEKKLSGIRQKTIDKEQITD